MVTNTEAMDLLQELENRNLVPIDNQAVADAGVADTSSLLGAPPGAELIILEELLSALPQANDTLDNNPTLITDPILGMDLS